MKKLTKAMAACFGTLLLALALCVPALAASQLDYVTDTAGLLSDSERTTLEQQAGSISDQYQCGVYIVTLDDFTAYVDTNDVEEAAKAIYQGYTLGCGEEQSGILLLLSLAERDYALVAYGYGNTAFTDYGKDALAEEFLDNFAQDDWSGGFADYLGKSASMLQSARSGAPLDVQTNPMLPLVGVLITIALGCVIAGGICLVLRQTMKSVAVGAEADAYIPAGGVAITQRSDIFTHTTEVRTKIESKSDKDSGGTTVDSEGFSSSSGKF